MSDPSKIPAAGDEPSRDTRSGEEQRRGEVLGTEPPASAGVELRAGDRLGGYEIVDLIGRGGMGDVYRATDAALQRTVAVKVLPLELARQSEFVHRFYAEASAAARLSHPHIIRIYQIAEDEGRHYFVMPFVEGGSLATRLRNETHLPIADSLRIVSEVLGGLAAAHAQGMIHRDIKPGNILLDARDGQAIVADFGLVKTLADPGQRTITGVILGSVDYMSPEQGRGQPVDGRSDLYSVGVLLYQMLSGELPFKADSPTGMIFQHVYEKPVPLPKRAPHVSPSLWTLVARLLAKNPDLRYSDAASALSDIEACREGRALPSRTDPKTIDVFWQPVRSVARNGQSGLLVCEPAFGAEPDLPAETSLTGGPLRWIVDWWRLRRPAFLSDLSKTQQQVDVAVSEYSARANQLRAYVREAESILRDLRSQRPHTAEVEAIAQLVSNQEQQLATMRLKLENIEATLGTLRSQRDVLNARLGAAHRRLGRVPSRRARLILAAMAAVLLLALAGLGSAAFQWIVATISASRKPTPTVGNPAAAQPKSPFPYPTTVLTEPVASRALTPAQSRDVAGLHLHSGKISILNAAGLHSFSLSEGGSSAASTDAALTSPQWTLPAAEGTLIRNASGPGPSGAVEIELRDLDLSKSAKVSLGGLTQLQAGRGLANSMAFLGVGRTASGFVLVESSEGGTTQSQDLPGYPPLSSAAISASREWIVGYDEGRALTTYRVPGKSGAPRTEALPLPAGPFALYPTLDRLVSTSPRGTTVTVWDLSANRGLAELDCREPIEHMVLDATARRLAVASKERVRIWDLELGSLRVVAPAKGCQAMVFSTDGDSLATISGNASLQVWPTPFPVVTVTSPPDPDPPADASPGPATASTSTKDDRPIAAGNGRYVLQLDKKPDQRSTVRLLDARSRKTLVDYSHFPNPISVALSWDERRVAIGTYDRSRGSAIELFDFHTGRRIARTRDFPGGPDGLQFSPDGRSIASCGEALLQIWDADSLIELHHAKNVASGRCRFSSDGRWVCVASGLSPNASAQVFLSQTCEQFLRLFKGHDTWAFEAPDDRSDPTYGRWRTLTAPGNSISEVSP